jgi:sugar phosphate isomerase/epimerase
VVVQIDDGPMKPVTDDYLAECTHYRTAPGEGEFDIAGFLSTAYGTGTTAPVSVEVMSDELDDLPVQTAAERLATATRRVLSRTS